MTLVVGGAISEVLSIAPGRTRPIIFLTELGDPEGVDAWLPEADTPPPTLSWSLEDRLMLVGVTAFCLRCI